MKKTVSLGTIKERGIANPCPVEIDVTLENGNLSISGNVWLPSRKDILMGGQCLDTLLEYEELNHPKLEKLRKIHAVWKYWHLNYMRAGCEHQNTPEMEVLRSKKVKIFRFHLDTETLRYQTKVKEESFKKLKSEGFVEVSLSDKDLLNLPWEKTLSIFEDEAPPEAPEHYIFSQMEYTRGNPEVKTLGWLTQSEHPDGQLSRPCGVCGYRYGSKWLKEELPADVIAEVESW